MIHTRLALALLGLASALLGCSSGSSDSAPPPSIAVTVSADSSSVEAGKTALISATVANDTRQEGVTWALNGPGTLSDFTSTSVTYHAPDEPPASDTNVSIAAISKADASKQGVVTITVPALSLSLSASDTVVQAAGSLKIDAQLFSDPSGKGVTWSLSPASGAGTLSNATGTSVTFNAPASPPPNDAQVTITATLVADTSKVAELTITVLALSVSLSASDPVVQAAGSSKIDAQVLSDPSGKGVSWSLAPASGAGTLHNATSTSVTYNAPASPPPSDVPVTITGTSVADTSKKGELTITLLAISVSLSGPDQLVPAGTSTTIDAQVSS